MDKNKFEHLEQAKNNVTKNLFNKKFNINERKDNEVLFSNKQILFEQYKMLLDSAYKTEERRASSNSMFLGINTLLSSFIIRPSQLETIQFIDIALILMSILLGIIICKEWLEVIVSYSRLNSINSLLIQYLEQFMPSCIFSLRTDIETQIENQNKNKKTNSIKNSINKGNIVLIKENFLPKTFMLFYIIYFLIIIIYCLINLLN